MSLKYNAPVYAAHDKTSSKGEAVHKTPPHQQIHPDFTPTWPARPTSIKHTAIVRKNEYKK